jgi:hypothetical protein
MTRLWTLDLKFGIWCLGFVISRARRGKGCVSHEGCVQGPFHQQFGQQSAQ